MRKLFVIFLLFIQLVFSFAYGQEAYSNFNNFYKNSQIYSANTNTHNTISVDFKGYENAILRLNQNQEEISELFSKNNNRINNIGFISDKKYLKNKLYKHNLTITFINAHDFSSNLKNEICTRAP